MDVEQLRLEVLVWVGLWEGVKEVDHLRDHLSREGGEDMVELLLLIIYAAKTEMQLCKSKPGPRPRSPERRKFDVPRLRRLVGRGINAGSTSAIGQALGVTTVKILNWRIPSSTNLQITKTCDSIIHDHARNYKST